jgi:hypothetical protein
MLRVKYLLREKSTLKVKSISMAKLIPKDLLMVKTMNWAKQRMRLTMRAIQRSMD